MMGKTLFKLFVNTLAMSKSASLIQLALLNDTEDQKFLLNPIGNYLSLYHQSSNTCVEIANDKLILAPCSSYGSNRAQHFSYVSKPLDQWVRIKIKDTENCLKSGPNNGDSLTQVTCDANDE